MNPTALTSILVAALIAASQFGCGKSDDTESNPLGIQGPENGSVPLRGFAGFGTQCPSGYNNDPKAVRLELWSCPLNLQNVELSEPVTPLMLSADCARKTLTIRTLDRTIDTPWEILPDGSFDIVFEGMNAKLKSDGAGNSDCVTPVITEVIGKVSCGPGRDQAKIAFDTYFYMNHKPLPGPSGTPSPAPSPTINPNLPNNPAPAPRPASPVAAVAAPASAPKCNIPADKCFMHASTSINQCM